MEFFSLFTSSLAFLLVLFVFFLIGKSSTKDPIISLFSWLAGVRQAIRNGDRLLEWTTELLAATPGNTVTTFFAVVTGNPSNVEHITKTNFHNYPKGDRILPCFHDFLGHGIFNSDGHLWKMQRRTASLQFTTKLIRSFTAENVQLELSRRLIPLLEKAAADAQTLDLQDVLDRFAFDNVCQVAFDFDPAYLTEGGAATAGEGKRFSQAFEEAMTLSSDRFRCPAFLWKLKRLFNVGSERRLRESVAVVHRLADKVVISRKTADSVGSGDLLSRFIAEGCYSDEALRDVIVSFILAGRDTTSSALSWFFWILSSRPDVERAILDEIRSVRRRRGNDEGGNGGFLTLDQLREMQYLHAVLTEMLRLYPVVPLEVRTSLADDVLPDGTFVGKGGVVMYNSYAMGRSEGIWGKDCGEFKPERWLEDGIFRPASPFRFPVFHAGPRTCLGKEMAYTQMKMVAASLLERFEVVVVGKEGDGGHLAGAIFRMRHGLPVRVNVRPLPKNIHIC